MTAQVAVLMMWLASADGTLAYHELRAWPGNRFPHCQSVMHHVRAINRDARVGIFCKLIEVPRS
jgi:hypothetical protein